MNLHELSPAAGSNTKAYRKGRGNYRKAPADILERALAAVKKREEMEKRREAMTQELEEGRVPAEIAANP